jgi:hypothetical protein
MWGFEFDFLAAAILIFYHGSGSKINKYHRILLF